LVLSFLPGKDMTDADEIDRRLAVAALADPSGKGRDDLVAGVLQRLRALAERQLRHMPIHLGDADDLVQEFLAKKVLPSEKLGKLLGPVVAGTRPLWLRLNRSLVNFLNSLRRRKRVRVDCAAGIGEGEHDAQDKSTDIFPDIFDRMATQLQVIRQAFPVPERGVPHGATLLLSERLWLAVTFAKAYEPADEQTTGNQTISEMVEAVAAWTEDDAARVLSPGLVLKAAWAAILDQTGQRPQKADPGLVAGIVGVPRGRWLQWLCRARKELPSRVGSGQARRLFSHWPSGPVERAEAAGEAGQP